MKGLDDEAFKVALDLTMTKLTLEPMTTLDLPAHVSYARHKFDIRSVSSVDGWLKHVSSKALREASLSDIAGEQERLWSERLSSILKMKEPDMKVALDELFDSDREFDLEEIVDNFVVSFGVCWHISGIEDLGSMVELAQDGLCGLESCLTNPSKKGTQLGSVLMSIPRGRKLMDGVPGTSSTSCEHESTPRCLEDGSRPVERGG